MTQGRGRFCFCSFSGRLQKHLEILSMNIICVAYSWFLRWVTQTSLIDILTFYRLPRSFTFRVLVSSSQHMCRRRFTSSGFYSWINFRVAYANVLCLMVDSLMDRSQSS